jgi:Na+/proline symporter
MARPDLYYIFAIYLSIIFGIAIYIYYENKKKTVKEDANQIGDHFLAGKSTNLLILCATTFSTIFSGYTMIGVPSEAYEDGKSSVSLLSVFCQSSVSLLSVFYQSSISLLSVFYQSSVSLLSVFCQSY